VPQKNVSVGITAFLDILGFGDRVLKARTISDIDAIAKDVRKIQSEFDHNPKDKLIKEVHANYRKTVLAFSDSVIVNVPLQSEMTKFEGTFDPLMSEITSMALAQGSCVASGLFLRGGVDLGWWYRRGATLASQSMVRAYKAEGRANVPVIALTDELYQYLSKHSHRNFYSKDFEPLKRLLRYYQAEMPDGKISFWYLDYITVCAESIDWIKSRAQHQSYLAASSDERQKIMEDGYKANLTTWFIHHAKVIKQAHKKAKIESVKSKYAWLASYHNEIASRFTESPACLCMLK
jgi:hypothetical protein